MTMARQALMATLLGLAVTVALADERPPIVTDEQYFSNGDISQRTHYYWVGSMRVYHGSYKVWDYWSHKLAQDVTYFDGILEGAGVKCTYSLSGDHNLLSRRESIYSEGFEVSATLYEYMLVNNVPCLDILTTYRYGLRHGSQKHYHKNGAVHTYDPCVNGVTHGTYRNYREDGTLWIETPFANGLTHGESRSYHPDGRLASIQPFSYGKAHGTAMSWYDNGFIASVTPYSNGKTCGHWETYFYSIEGKVMTEGDSAPAEPLCNPNSLPEGRTVSGTVVDRIFGVPLAGVKVSVGGAETTTDATGHFTSEVASDTTVGIACSGNNLYGLNGVIPVAGKDTIDVNLTMMRVTSKPTLSQLESRFPASAIFLAGVPVENTYSATVDWKTSPPGTVTYRADGNGQSVVPTGTASNHVEKTYVVTALPFVPSLLPDANQVVIQAQNPSFERSTPESFTVNLIPMPAWAAFLGGFSSGPVSGRGVISYQIKAAYPADPLKIAVDEQTLGPALWSGWSLMPVIGGKRFGLPPTQAFVDIEAKSDGSGSVTVGGISGFEAAGQKLEAKIGGKGNVAYTAGSGYEWNGGSIQFALDGTLTQEVGPVTVIPALASAVSLPVVGRPISWFNERAKVVASVYAGYGIDLKILDKDGVLGLSGAAGDIKTGLNMGVATELSKVKASILGGGETILSWHAPADPQYLDKVVSKIYAKAVFNVWTFEQTFASEYALTYTYGEAVRSASRLAGAQPLASTSNSRNFAPIDLCSSGRAAHFTLATPGAMPTETAAFQVYPYSDLALATCSNRTAVAYVDYKRTKPVGQATDIGIVLRDEAGTLSYHEFASDTRAEFAPSMAMDGQGRCVVAWERVRTPAFVSTNLNDMASEMEIVAATFDPQTGLWGTLQPLTTNTWLDHSPMMLASPVGDLALLWQDNAANEIWASPAAPTRLNVAFWNATSAVFEAAAGAPPLFTNLVSVAATFDGTRVKAFLQLDGDGDLLTSDDSSIVKLVYSAGNWSPPETTVADSGVGRPWAGTATGGIDRIWMQSTNLLHSHLGAAGQMIGTESIGNAETITYRAATDPQRGVLAVVAQAPTTKGIGLAATIYDTDHASWSHTIPLASGDRIPRNAVPAFTPDGDLVVTYLADSLTPTGSLAQTDLAITDLPIGHDLAPVPGSLSFSALPTAGHSVTARVSIVNSGELAVDGALVSFHLGSTTSIVQKLADVPITPALLPGRTTGYAEIVLTPTTNTLLGALYAVVDEAGDVTERCETNNAISRSILLPDLVITDCQISPAAALKGLRLKAILANRGESESGSTEVLISFGTRSSGLIHVPTIRPGRIREVPFELYYGTDLTGSVTCVDITVDPQERVQESCETNNARSLCVGGNPDEDGDGLPDWWERRHYASLVHTAEEDTDGDGLSCAQELRLGTDPTNAASGLSMSLAVQPAGTAGPLAWPTAVGMRYELWATPSLFADWELREIVSGNGSDCEYPCGGLGPEFFRLKIREERQQNPPAPLTW